jgi:hypothetical protein
MPAWRNASSRLLVLQSNPVQQNIDFVGLPRWRLPQHDPKGITGQPNDKTVALRHMVLAQRLSGPKSPNLETIATLPHLGRDGMIPGGAGVQTTTPQPTQTAGDRLTGLQDRFTSRVVSFLEVLHQSLDIGAWHAGKRPMPDKLPELKSLQTFAHDLGPLSSTPLSAGPRVIPKVLQIMTPQ